jgi:hypothetical protein
MDASISQTDFIKVLSEHAANLSLSVDTAHYETHSEYYWKNKMQFISVIQKKIPDDKLKIIFQTHIQKVDSQKVEEPILLVYPPVKLIPTMRYSTYVWQREP